MATLAISFLAYTDSGSVLHSVLVAAAYALPAALLSVAAARTVERIDPARLLIVTNGAKIVVYLGMAIVSSSGRLDTLALVGFSAITGCISAFVFPAWQIYSRGVVDPDDLPQANAMWTSLISVGSLVGAAGGGLVIGAFGASSVFVIDAASYVLLSLAILWTPSTTTPLTQRSKVTIASVVAEVRANPRLKGSLLRLVLLTTLIFPIAQFLPAMAAELSTGPHMFGALAATSGAGSALVVWRLPRLKSRMGIDAIVLRSFAGCTVALLVAGLADAVLDPWPLIVPIFAATFTMALLAAMAQSVLTALVQLHAGTKSEGGVHALLGVVFAVGPVVGGLVFGPLADRIDVYEALSVVGVVTAIATAALVAWMAARRPQQGDESEDWPGRPGGRGTAWPVLQDSFAFLQRTR